MSVPLSGKRAMVRNHFEQMSREAQAQAAKAAAWAAFIDHRASVVDAMPEVELDLLLADWKAARTANVVRNEASQHLGTIVRTMEVFATAAAVGEAANARMPKPGEVWRHRGIDVNAIEYEMRVCDPAHHGPRPDGQYRVALLDFPEAVCLFPRHELEFVRES